jgi:Dyp-type peroxidase family
MESRITLPLDQIQGIVLSGYGHLLQARFALLTVRSGRAPDAKRFLSGLKLTSSSVASERKVSAPSINLAFTHAGLAALGLDSAILDNFPRDFVEGPTLEARARLLGDQGESRPADWLWGSPTTEPVHVALLIYAQDGIEATCEKYLRAAVAAGLDVASCLTTIHLPRRQEHFGFRDGIGQPLVVGSRDVGPEGNFVAAGEMFLGRENAFGEIAHVPGAFALDGSYLVLRQLEQDVPGFWAFCREHASTDNEAVRLASQMVGRWPSGFPLVKHAPIEGNCDPVEQGESDDDAFGYAEHDPKGLRCPLGAHIRRSNPRDTIVAGSPEESVTVTSRHRIMRRGRAYGEPFCPDAQPTSYLKALGAADPNPSRGLHFLCFNASIEQQFEFVQRQWCDNPKLAGAVNGADPLIGDHRPIAGEPPTFSIQRETTAERVPIPKRFVRTRGGAYLLMPTLGAIASLRDI